MISAEVLTSTIGAVSRRLAKDTDRSESVNECFAKYTTIGHPSRAGASWRSNDWFFCLTAQNWTLQAIRIGRLHPRLSRRPKAVPAEIAQLLLEKS
jgi:hypothetical protein